MLFEKLTKNYVDRVKKSEPKMDFDEEKREYSKSVTIIFPKISEANSTSGAFFNPYKNYYFFLGAKDDLNDVKCCKCHKTGHYTNKCPEIKPKVTKRPLKLQKNG